MSGRNEKFCAKCGQRVTALPSFKGSKIYHFNCAPDDADVTEASLKVLRDINAQEDREAMSKARTYIKELLAVRGEDETVRDLCEKAIGALE